MVEIKVDNSTTSQQNINTDTEYVATMSMGANKDPMAAGTKRGYQRGETYRFGVLVYDKNGDPGNVLWMGDIQMPGHMDKAWELDLDALDYTLRNTHVDAIVVINPGNPTGELRGPKGWAREPTRAG